MNPLDSLKAQEIEIIADHLLGHIAWFILFVFIAMLFKSTGEEIVAGIQWRFRSDFNNRDVILLDDEWTRITHIGITRTEFYVFIINDKNETAGGYVMFVSNSELKKHKIKKQLDLIKVPTELLPITQTKGVI